MIIGTISSIIAGASMNFFLFYFGDITTIYVSELRNEAAAKGLQLLIKFAIIGGISWISSKLSSI
jgi:hypothetical protein